MFADSAAVQVPLRTDEDGVVRVGHTRVTLQTVIADFHRGASPEEIAHHYPALKLSDVYLVVGYYLEHRSEVDDYVRQQRNLAAQARQEYESLHPQDALREKLSPELLSIIELWNSQDERLWLSAEEHYWDLVKPGNLALERQLDDLDSSSVARMNEQEFYRFLHDAYFVWKYTAPNRLATTRMQLQKYRGNLASLRDIHARLFSFELNDIKTGLTIAKEIHGLGTAGASGLLAVLFPKYFGTVDQFAVKALMGIDNLPEHRAIARMKPEGLTIPDGEILIEIMRSKASKLNELLNTKYWTPRKIDKILWVIGR